MTFGGYSVEKSNKKLQVNKTHSKNQNVQLKGEPSKIENNSAQKDGFRYDYNDEF